MENYHETYYQKNKELMDQRSKEWKIKNKEKWNSYQAAYKRKKKQKEDGDTGTDLFERSVSSGRTDNIDKEASI